MKLKKPGLVTGRVTGGVALFAMVIGGAAVFADEERGAGAETPVEAPPPAPSAEGDQPASGGGGQDVPAPPVPEPAEPDEAPALPTRVTGPEDGEALENGEELFDRLEWRGILALPGDVQFSLHDPSGGRGFWISESEPRLGIEIEDYDAEENTLTIRFGEEIRSLALAGGGGVPMADQPVPAAEAEPAPEPEQPPVPDTAQDEPGEPHPELERLYGAWEQTVAESPQLQQVQQQAAGLHENLAETTQQLQELEADDPERANLEARRNELQSEMRRLETIAVTEARSSEHLQDEDTEALVTTIRSVLYPREGDEGGEPSL